MAAHPVELVLPDEPAPVRLMNTTWVDRDGVFEALADGSDLRGFLVAVGRPVPDALDAAQLGAIHELRSGLRTLARTADGPTAPSPDERRAALAAVNAAMALA